MFKRKIFVLLTSLLVLAFALQACAAPAEEPAAEEPAAEEPAAEEPAAEEPAAEPAEPIEIRVSIAFTDKRLDWTVERANEFNALYPQYNVLIDPVGSYNEVFQAAMLGAEQGKPPAMGIRSSSRFLMLSVAKLKSMA